jgi:hypothetical protein
VEQQEQVYTAIAQIIRERSETGQLVQFEEILTELTGQGLLTSEADDPRPHLQGIVREAVKTNEDLREIPGAHGIAYFYSTQTLSETYAVILARKKGDPLELIAQIVRENSSVYPRPVPLDLFRESPFDLTGEEILACLDKMGQQKKYQDIAQTTTSIGTKFLFSSRHLNPDYASKLAEWFDVGQINNP